MDRKRVGWLPGIAGLLVLAACYAAGVPVWLSGIVAIVVIVFLFFVIRG